MSDKAPIELDRRSIRTGCETKDNRSADAELKRLGYVFNVHEQRWEKPPSIYACCNDPNPHRHGFGQAAPHVPTPPAPTVPCSKCKKQFLVTATHWTTCPECRPVAPEGRAEPLALVDRIIQRVAELPDRTSPDDWPHAMLVTANELRNIIQTELEAATPNPALPVPEELMHAPMCSCGFRLTHDSVARNVSYWRCTHCGNPHWFNVVGEAAGPRIAHEKHTAQCIEMALLLGAAGFPEDIPIQEAVRQLIAERSRHPAAAVDLQAEVKRLIAYYDVRFDSPNNRLKALIKGLRAALAAPREDQ